MTVTLGTHNFTIHSWNTLPGKILLMLCREFRTEVNPASMKVKLFLIMCGAKVLRQPNVTDNYGCVYSWFYMKGEKVLLNNNAVSHIADKIIENFYSKTEEGNYTLKVDLYRNKIPAFKIGLRKYAGPTDGLSNLSFKEFIHTETNFSKYHTNKSPEQFDRLLALLFRPKKRFLAIRKRLASYNGDDRIRFNDFHIQRLAKKLKRLDPATKQAIYYYYIGSRKFLSIQFPELFSGSSGGENVDVFRNYLDIVDCLAKSNPVEKEQIRNLQLYDVLDSLNNLIKNQQKNV